MRTLLFTIAVLCFSFVLMAQPTAVQVIPFDGDPSHVVNGNGDLVPLGLLSVGSNGAAGVEGSALFIDANGNAYFAIPWLQVGWSDQFTIGLNTNVAIGPDARMTNSSFVGNNKYPVIDVGTNAGTFNLDMALSSEFTMSLAGNATVGFTNWSDFHPVNLMITNTGAFSITITNTTIYWIGSGNSTQPAIEQGAGIVNIYHFWRSGGRIFGSLEGRPMGFVILPLVEVDLPAATPARFGTNATGIRYLAFATNETAYFQFTMPQDYGFTPTLRMPYSSSGGTSGSASFSVSVWAQTPGDALDADTASFDTANTGSDVVPGTLNFPDVIVIALTTIDTMAAGDIVILKVTSTSPSSLNDVRLRGGLILEYVKK